MAAPSDLITALSNLVVSLKVLKWVAWNAHWSARGSNFYSDHLLMERVYSKVDDQIDTVVENIIGYSSTFGINLNQATWAITVEQSTLSGVSSILRKREESISHVCVQKAVEGVKLNCSEVMKQYNLLSSTDAGSVVLGIEDFVPAIAKKMDSFVYLLAQRGK